MKPQDILFLVVLIGLFVWKRNPKIYVAMGLFCIFLSIPLFVKHVFFTAEHLTYYAGGFLLISIVLFIINELRGYKHENK